MEKSANSYSKLSSQEETSWDILLHENQGGIASNSELTHGEKAIEKKQFPGLTSNQSLLSPVAWLSDCVPLG